MDRHLEWSGCVNVHDLGGLPIAGGGEIRRGALVRADALPRLTAEGWAALQAHGVRTVIDLRNDDERSPDDAPRPSEIETVQAPLDGMEDTEFWEQWMHRAEFGTPAYYRPWLDRFPERAARVLTAIARARPGGVAFHCGIGRDRTGLVSILVLALAGVAPADIAADYDLGAAGVSAAHVAAVGAFYAREGTSGSELVLELLAGLDVEAYMRRGGLEEGDLAVLRERMSGR